MAHAGHRAQRTCLGCRQVRSQDELMRFVLTPDGELVPDYRRKLPGRGAYTCIDRHCISAAAQRRQFDRSFKGGNKPVDADVLIGQVASRIRERVANLLGMARKSGQAVSGSNAVLTLFRTGAGAELVVLAEDVSEGIGDKIRSAAANRSVPVYRLFDKAFLGQVSGKGERSVLALRSGPLAETINKEILRYKHSVGES